MSQYKEILHGKDARDKLIAGIDKLADTVKATLGPNGKTVLFSDTNGKLVATKDGVSVAKQVRDLKDPFENYGAMLARQAAEKTLQEVGDGTTTSTILAQAFIKEGIKLLDSGVQLTYLRKEWNRLKDDIIQELKKITSPCKTMEDKINVATISANNDRELGKLIATAITKVGKDGVLTVEEDKENVNDSFELQKGMQIKRGFVSPYFINNTHKHLCEFVDSKILVLAESIENFPALVPLLEKIHSTKTPLVIFCNSISDSVLQNLIPNVTENHLKLCVVEIPGEGLMQEENAEDISAVVNAPVIKTSLGKLIKHLTESDFGECKRTLVTPFTTTLIVKDNNNQKVKARITSLKEAMEDVEDKEALKRRIARLSGGIGTIKIGKGTEIEQKEKRDRVEDALFATTAAIEDGIVAGGGMALYDSSFYLTGLPELSQGFKEVCRTPSNLLGTNESEIEGKVDDTVVDPAKVVRVALENALSLALTVLSIDAIISINESQDSFLTIKDLEKVISCI